MTRDLDDNPVLSARDVGKCYHIYDRPQDRLWQVLRRSKRYYREFWALRGASLELRRGGALAIIGRNGSGKSTLLQMIAGTLHPSEGEVRHSGRVAALLELGSGFNPEFTGRENVYLNGAILGLARERIDERFDTIAAFADIGDFLERPVKTYSSGMVVRLAFSVAAHLDADIMIIDEALAVGDEAFQRKCYAWLERFRADGGTLLFVTHDAQTVVRLCDQAILLEAGHIVARGPSKPVVDVYQKLLYGSEQQAAALRQALNGSDGAVEQLELAAARKGAAAKNGRSHSPHQGEGENDASRGADSTEPEAESAYFDDALVKPAETTYGVGGAVIKSVGTFDEHGRRANVLLVGRRCELRYQVQFEQRARGVRFGMMIKTTDGIDVAGVSSVHVAERLENAEVGSSYEARFSLALNLAPGTYFLNCGVSAMCAGEETYLHRRVDVAVIRAIPSDDRDIYGLAFVEPSMTVRSLPVAAARSSETSSRQ